MTSDVDQFLSDLKHWQAEIFKLRAIMLATGLEESLKWRQPCYSVDGANVAIIQPFKDKIGLMFFKGLLLKDPRRILVDNGPNSRSSRRIELKSVAEITKLSAAIKAYVKEAVELEQSGLKIPKLISPEPMPTELRNALGADSKLKSAFKALTPGRQRAYILFIAGAKKSETRISRIEGCRARILAGRGLQDR